MEIREGDVSPEREEIADEEVVGALRKQGAEHPEVSALLARWSEQEEHKVPPHEAGQIAFNRRRAKVYLAGGYPEEALDALEGARTEAWNNGLAELYDEIMQEMDAIENRSSRREE